MSLYLSNSLSGQKEIFSPFDASLIKMYVCGPTVYDSIHIGNARSLVVYDVLYRMLVRLYGEKSVVYVRNITDVDDKINIRAKELGISIFELTKKTIEIFHQDTKYLNCLAPTIEPKATDHISQMTQLIQKLLNNNSAYVQNKTVYFDVTSFKDYGKLAGRKLEDSIAGVRIEIDQEKRHPEDFVLWKPATVEDDPSAVFDSPWGAGQPGWHLECSSMAHHYLGEDFDIHGGGIDLIFPHHTNEVAQSCCAFPGSKFARYWVHNGFLKLNGQKMSKSLNNFLTVADMRNKNISTDAIRYALLNTHYHKPLEFNDNVLSEAKNNIEYLQRTTQNCDTNNITEFTDEFFKFLFDDLNTHSALSYLLKLAKNANKTQDTKIKESLKYCANFLGLLESNQVSFATDNDQEIELLIAQRLEAKLAKNWALADKIRNDLKQQGIILEDLKDGTTTWLCEK
jgi:cysteinyl-tRNA synthetase